MRAGLRPPSPPTSETDDALSRLKRVDPTKIEKLKDKLLDIQIQERGEDKPGASVIIRKVPLKREIKSGQTRRTYDDIFRTALYPLTAVPSATARPHLESNDRDSVWQVRAGYPNASLTNISKLLGVSEESVISLLQLPRSTVKRQQSQGRPFSLEISDRLYRVRRLVDMSTAAIGDRNVAVRWLMRQHPALGGVTPLSLVDTTAGYERVADELQRITYGVVA